MPGLPGTGGVAILAVRGFRGLGGLYVQGVRGWEVEVFRLRARGVQALVVQSSVA